MYVCTLPRCKYAWNYGQETIVDVAVVWQGYGANAMPAIGRLKAGTRVQTKLSRYVTEDGRQVKWYQLVDGGWMSEAWLTKEPCSLNNLQPLGDDCRPF